MKFLVLFSVLALCALNVNGLFHKHFSKGGASASAGSSSNVASSNSASASSSGSSSGGLGGLGNILAIPLSIKKQLLISHQKKINARFDKIINHLDRFSSKFNSASSSSAGANAGVSAGVDSGVGLSAGADYGVSENTGFETSEFSSGSSSSSSSANSNSESSYTGLSINDNSAGQYDTGFQAQSYQPQPAAQVHSYQPQPAQVHSYQPEPAPQAHSYHPQPAAQTQYHETPTTVELYHVQQPQVVQRIEPAPIAPAQTYGPPSYQPPAPISVQPQVIPEIQRDYLPPHTHRAGCTHRRH